MAKGDNYDTFDSNSGPTVKPSSKPGVPVTSTGTPETSSGKPPVKK